MADLLTEVRELQKNPAKIADAIGIRGSTISDTNLSELDALRQEVESESDVSVDPVIKKFVTAATDTLFGLTGSSLEHRRPWYTKPKAINIHSGLALGRGAYGEVYMATMDGTIVAVKFFRKIQFQFLEVSLEQVAYKSFTLRRYRLWQSKLQEIALWCNLSHPHVLKLIGANIFSRPPFAVSPYCINGNALAYLQSRGRAADKVCLVGYLAPIAVLFCSDR
jgi:hypothetical protein